MADVDTGGRDRLALAVLVQYRMATTEQMRLIISPGVRVEQTLRRLMKLREEGLVDRITLPQAGRTQVWHPTQYGAQIASEWPELRSRRPLRGAVDRTAVRLKVGHGLTVTETALAFLQDAHHRGDLCRPLDWIPEVHHPLGGGEAVIPDALLYYQRRPTDGTNRTTGMDSADGGNEDRNGVRGGVMLRAFVEVDRATMGPERLAAKLSSYARLHSYAPVPVVRQRQPPFPEPAQETWRQRYPLFPRLLFVLDGTSSTGVETRINALRAATRGHELAAFLREVPVLAAPMTDLLQHGPTAPIWRPTHDPDRQGRLDAQPELLAAMVRATVRHCADPDHNRLDPDHEAYHRRPQHCAAERAAIAQPHLRHDHQLRSASTRCRTLPRVRGVADAGGGEAGAAGDHPRGCGAEDAASLSSLRVVSAW
ncbi:replication-relaxation family protein [Streptomyces sp. NPDC014676]|uniref:replication-relaxation family protein n=1 Tax=Streptomyces sp. NPDC014676 TaxID=3364879 RepID=UPI0037025E08